MGLLTVMKGTPLAYNKDMQEDKECVFDAVDTLSSCIPVFTGMLHTLTFKKEEMEKSAGRGFTNATDVADYLVTKGLPFRDAHSVVGHLVLYCEQHQISIDALSRETLRTFSPLFEEDVFGEISLSACIEKRQVPGGPSEASVKAQIAEAEAFVNQLEK